MSTKIRTYSELVQIPDFLGRYEYLRIGGKVGEETFGFDRYLNQLLYNSGPWKKSRRKVIERDLGCDLGILDREIEALLVVHHMNPITEENIVNRDAIVYDPEFLITTSDRTHKAIHYGNRSLLIAEPVIRKPGDTCLWR